MAVDGHQSEVGAADALTTLHVRQAVAGDRQSADWLVTRLSPLLLAHARYRLGNLARQHDPEDIVHDAWLVALPRFAELTARGGRFTPVLLRFLSTTVVNRVRNLRYERARRGSSQSPSRVEADCSGPISHAMRNECTASVHAAIDRLDSADREVVLLRGVEQVSAQAAAVVLGISLDAVNKRYQRALARLRAHMPGSVFDEVEP
jgi:RNA polymerase sigma-70 factor (ECF subfamily)